MEDDQKRAHGPHEMGYLKLKFPTCIHQSLGKKSSDTDARQITTSRDFHMRLTHQSPRLANLAMSLLLTSIILAACTRARGVVVWTTRAASPDGSWYASAKTVQNGGFGSAFVETTVALNERGHDSTRQTVLLLSGAGAVPHPYTLDDVANKGGTVDLTLKWTSPTHLLITYTGSPTIYLETIRYKGITITVDHGTGTKLSGRR